MSLVHANNFEAYQLGAAGWTSLKALEGWAEGDGGTPSVCSIVEPGWHSRRALRVPVGAIASLPVTFPAATRVLCAQAAFKLDAMPADDEHILFSFAIVQVRLHADGSLSIDNGVDATRSEPGFVKPGQWHYLETKAHQGIAGCRMNVLIDGLDVAGMTGIQTSTSSGHSVNFHSADVGVTWSEPIVMNGIGPKCNDLLGVDARIALMLPFKTHGETGFTWSPASAPLHSMIDDPLPGPSDGNVTEVASGTPGQAFLVTFGSPPVARSYEAVTALIEGVRSDGSAPTFDAVAISIDSARASGNLESTPGAKALARLTLDLDPKGGKPWTRKALTALQVGSSTAAPPI